MKHLIEAPQEIPVIGEYDVVILGGGPAGVSAAVSASRAGAKTAIIERYGYLGGQATGGLVILIVGLTDGKERIIKGFCEETINRLISLNATKDENPHVLFDPEMMKYVFDCMIEENNVTPYYHNYVSNAIISANNVSGVIVESKSGKNVIKGRVFVDATGDGDLAKYSNAPFYIEDKDNLLPVTLGFRVGGIDTAKVRSYTDTNKDEYRDLLNGLGISTTIGGWIETTHPNEAWFNISNITNINSTSSQDLTKAEIQGRKQIYKIIEAFKEKVPGFENGYLIDTASQIGVRESRRIKGLHLLTKEELKENFEDTIALAPDYTESGPGSIKIPYRCLLSTKTKNIIFAGRCISVSHELINMIREIPCCMATGQAAGVAAALSVKNIEDHFASADKVDIKTLRESLAAQGAIL